jgi:cyclic pyranopterin phosphate synthase
LCLGQEDAISLKDAVRSDLTNDEIKTMIVNAINKKPEKHEFNTVVDIWKMAFTMFINQFFS